MNPPIGKVAVIAILKVNLKDFLDELYLSNLYFSFFFCFVSQKIVLETGLVNNKNTKESNVSEDLMQDHYQQKRV